MLPPHHMAPYIPLYVPAERVSPHPHTYPKVHHYLGKLGALVTALYARASKPCVLNMLPAHPNLPHKVPINTVLWNTE